MMLLTPPPVWTSASEAGHQEEAHGQVGPGEERGPPSHRAVDAGQPVQRERLRVEPRDAGRVGTTVYGRDT